LEKISFLCPTRSRTQTDIGNFVDRLIETARETADYPDNVEFVFYIDDDDKQSEKYFKGLDDDNIVFVQGERIVLSKMWNECCKKSSGDIFFHCGDDIRFRTKGWDTIVRNKFDEFDDKIVFVYGSDGFQAQEGESGNKFGTHGFIHRNWVETTGYFVPPYFSSDKNDTWLNDVALKIGRHHWVDIYTEHLHPVVGKMIWDKTHMERLQRGAKDNVHAMYDKLEDERIRDAKLLEDFINGKK
tara:strand:- start:5662 stop:6387 length:726 start_codon:yes stop_codon:yes gene_type:complete